MARSKQNPTTLEVLTSIVAEHEIRLYREDGSELPLWAVDAVCGEIVRLEKGEGDE